MPTQLKITINDQRKIHAIQEEFNETFPYLKLEFFSKPHTKFGGSPKKTMKNSAKTLGECRTVHQKGHISIVPSMTVSELEQSFQDTYGLSIQVFRKSGKAWLETTATDSWTLEKQNSEGEELSNFKNELIRKSDLDLD